MSTIWGVNHEIATWKQDLGHASNMAQNMQAVQNPAKNQSAHYDVYYPVWQVGKGAL